MNRIERLIEMKANAELIISEFEMLKEYVEGLEERIRSNLDNIENLKSDYGKHDKKQLTLKELEGEGVEK